MANNEFLAKELGHFVSHTVEWEKTTEETRCDHQMIFGFACDLCGTHSASGVHQLASLGI